MSLFSIVFPVAGTVDPLPVAEGGFDGFDLPQTSSLVMLLSDGTSTKNQLLQQGSLPLLMAQVTGTLLNAADVAILRAAYATKEPGLFTDGNGNATNVRIFEFHAKDRTLWWEFSITLIEDMPDARRPTLMDLVAAGNLVYRREGWIPNYDFGAANAGQMGVSQTDRIVFLHPTGDPNVFASEYGVTGATIPDFSSAPNRGDSVNDSGTTWYNVGPAASFPPSPVVWTPDTANDPNRRAVLWWPPTPNGHLYGNFPGYAGNTGSSLPTFATDGDYNGDGDGYVVDLGAVV